MLKSPCKFVVQLATAFAVLTAVSTTANAGSLIRPDTATASSFFSPAFAPELTIDGSGLPADFSPADDHNIYLGGNHWTTSGGSPAGESITWGFGVPQELGSVHLWNHQSTLPSDGGVAVNDGYDVTLFDLTLFSGLSAVLFLNDVSLAPNTSAAQTISFGESFSGVTSVLFEIEGVEGSPTFTGLAEVAFSSTPVPEPSSIGLAFLLVSAVGASRVGRKSAVLLQRP